MESARAAQAAGARVVVLGGYGLFGGRMVRTLANEAGLALIVAGRDQARARDFIHALGDTRATLQPVALDVEARDFAARLAALAPTFVIHAAGPFQQRSYAVATAALDCSAHYADLADARGFVTGIHALDARARDAQRWVLSGASSVPGISAAVVAAHLDRFQRLDSVDTAISPGNRTPRGLATTRAILGDVGKPFPALIDGHRRSVHGWQSLRAMRVPGVGTRWLARCDVPDLDVLPQRHPQLRHCDFRAGLELRRMHFGLHAASWAVRAGAIASMRPYAERLLALSERWLHSGSDIGVMRMDLRGTGTDGAPLALRWLLLARNGDGPQVPCTPAIVLARKLARGDMPGGGASACVDVFALEDLVAAFAGFAIETSLTRLKA